MLRKNNLFLVVLLVAAISMLLPVSQSHSFCMEYDQVDSVTIASDGGTTIYEGWQTQLHAIGAALHCRSGSRCSPPAGCDTSTFNQEYQANDLGFGGIAHYGSGWVQWTSSDSSALSVDSDGVVTAGTVLTDTAVTITGEVWNNDPNNGAYVSGTIIITVMASGTTYSPTFSTVNQIGANDVWPYDTSGWLFPYYCRAINTDGLFKTVNNVDITWSLFDTTYASIDSSGFLTEITGLWDNTSDTVYGSAYWNGNTYNTSKSITLHP